MQSPQYCPKTYMDQELRVDYLQEHLKKIAKILNIDQPCFRMTRGAQKGQHLIGDIFRVTIKGSNDKKSREIRVILKCAPRDRSRRESMKSMPIFPREIMFYQEIVPVFVDLLKEHDMILENIPKFYGANATETEEVIFMEDLNEKNYMVRNRLKLLDYSHASLVVQELGRLHAYSFALRDKKPEIFEKFKNVQDILFTVDSHGTDMFLDRLRELQRIALKSLKQEGNNYVKRARHFTSSFWAKMSSACDGSHAEPYAVICHGDAWTNNFMFKYEDEANKNPLSMYFLDFQMCRYAAPDTDLTYTLFCCCNKETRAQHYKQLLQHYHSSLSNCLKRFGCDAELLFPFGEFTKQLRKFGYFGVGMAIFTLHVFTKVDADAKEISKRHKDVAEAEERLDTDVFYKSMLADALTDAADMNYI